MMQKLVESPGNVDMDTPNTRAFMFEPNPTAMWRQTHGHCTWVGRTWLAITAPSTPSTPSLGSCTAREVILTHITPQTTSLHTPVSNRAVLLNHKAQGD